MENDRTESSNAVAIMQPYFLPYLGYFSLIKRVNHFVFLDSVQYVRKGWINRNRIRAATPEGWTYFGIPVEKAPQSTLISEIKIHFGDPWQEKLKKTLIQTYQKAPHFEETFPLLEPLWKHHGRLVDPLIELTKRIAEHLELRPRWTLSSALESLHPELRELKGQDLILGICKNVHAKVYWNPSGGRELYRLADFLEREVGLNFIEPLALARIRQRFPQANDLSIFDLLMWNTRQSVIEMLEFQ